MSTPELEGVGQWVVEGRCPHGYRVYLPFDELGYVLKPKDEACNKHRKPKVELDERAIRRETRRARRALKKRPPWLSS